MKVDIKMKSKKRLNKLFIGREEAKHLQKLGLDMSDATFAWYPVYDKFGYFVEHKIDYWSSGLSNIVPTYSLQEVLDKLPKRISKDGADFQISVHCLGNIAIRYSSIYSVAHLVYSRSFLDAAYKMLCWVLENGYLKQNEL